MRRWAATGCSRRAARRTFRSATRWRARCPFPSRRATAISSASLSRARSRAPIRSNRRPPIPRPVMKMPGSAVRAAKMPGACAPSCAGNRAMPCACRWPGTIATASRNSSPTRCWRPHPMSRAARSMCSRAAITAPLRANPPGAATARRLSSMPFGVPGAPACLTCPRSSASMPTPIPTTTAYLTTIALWRGTRTAATQRDPTSRACNPTAPQERSNMICPTAWRWNPLRLIANCTGRRGWIMTGRRSTCFRSVSRWIRSSSARSSRC